MKKLIIKEVVVVSSIKILFVFVEFRFFDAKMFLNLKDSITLFRRLVILK